MEYLFPYPKMGHSFTEILEDPLSKKLLGHDAVHAEEIPFIKGVSSRLTYLLNDATKHLPFLKIGYTALEAFLQATVTGPPLDFDSEPVVIPENYRGEALPVLKQELFQYLSVDGDAVYSLVPRIELFWLAKVVMSNSMLADSGFNGRRARFRVNFWHQKLLHEKSDALQQQLYLDADILEDQLSRRLEMRAAASEEHFVEFLLERAAVRTYYGDDVKARDDLARAAEIRDFEFALTGALGKRTKFQENDVSQLVVLAKSRAFEPEPYNSRKSSRADPSSRKSSLDIVRSPKMHHRPGTPASSVAALSIEPHSPPSSRKASAQDTSTQPENVLLNDDTLLENIQFTQKSVADEQLTQIKDPSALQPELTHLDAGHQPLLFPVDSIILLSVASSITNTSPSDGLTREETLPYATRVLEGGSSNWQVYTQALLVRSRIEGFRSRTAERGLLQLQALVDQVVAETSDTKITSNKGDDAGQQSSTPTTFLPRAGTSESASVAERLKYIYQLSPPLRWELEVELAERWTQLGGLRSALEIYERLQMQAEVALCLAATDREAEAIKLLRSLLFRTAESGAESTPELKQPPPANAPRLLCILGDFLQEPKHYLLAWTTSNRRYARAQRSLGRYYAKHQQLPAAAEAYKQALHVTRLDNSTWFALGCIQLELQDWPAAVESFTRVIQLEDRDAEGWSNLAAALLQLPPPTVKPRQHSQSSVELGSIDEERESGSQAAPDPLQHRHEALRALRRAATLKRDDARIWDNYLTVAASIPPRQGTPWNELIQAMTRVIDLRSKQQGEAAVDLRVLRGLIDYTTKAFEYPQDHEPESQPSSAPNLNTEATHTNGEDHTTPTPTPSAPQPQPKRLPFQATALLHLIDTSITPLASTPTLFTLLSRVSLWRHRPAESLAYTEKAWRATTAQPAVYETEAGWADIVDATLRLVHAYQTLGDAERERTGGPVEKGWRFKSRSAVRGVLGRGKESWEGSEGWQRLEASLEASKG